MILDRRSFTRRGVSAFVLAAYTSISFLYFGLRPFLRGYPSIVGGNGDAPIFIWSFAWWPHAVLTGDNPFVTHEIWAPDGLNLAWTTSVPGLAFLFAPLTLLVGPITAFNVAAVLMPALSAWTCFLLCRHVTGSIWPSIAGGCLFGFSSYMLGHEQGHLNLTAVFLIPLIALVLVCWIEETVNGRQLVLRLGLLLAAQLLVSTEIFFTATLAIMGAGAIAYASLQHQRARRRALIRPLVGAYVLAAALTARLTYFVLTGFVQDP